MEVGVGVGGGVGVGVGAVGGGRQTQNGDGRGDGRKEEGGGGIGTGQQENVVLEVVTLSLCWTLTGTAGGRMWLCGEAPDSRSEGRGFDPR